MSDKKPYLCIYHADCLDGFSAAYVVGLQFGFDKVEFLALNYGDAIPDLTDRMVLIVDFSFKPDVLLPAAQTAKSVVMMDHHAGAIEEWWGHDLFQPEYNLVVNFKVEVSGAELVWQTYFKEVEVPLILKRAGQYDLWQNLDESKPIAEALRARGFIRDQDFSEFDRIVRKVSAAQLKAEGQVLDHARQTEALETADRSTGVAIFMGHRVPICNTPYRLVNIIGERLAKNQPFAVLYEDNLAKGHRKYSLRSEKGRGVDVKEIAKKFGGGGHENAAGFVVKFDDLRGGTVMLESLHLLVGEEL